MNNVNQHEMSNQSFEDFLKEIKSNHVSNLELAEWCWRQGRRISVLEEAIKASLTFHDSAQADDFLDYCLHNADLTLEQVGLAAEHCDE